ncbi:MAG: ATP-grasp domain-containing protein [Chloroflexi bacterium]|nr:ATP-grasp domain-containing protein [Chloroflexota bacterium]
MCARVTIVYNEPVPSRYDARHEEQAVRGVLDSVTAVHCSLLELGHEVTLMPLMPPPKSIGEKLRSLPADVIFNLFEGFPGAPETEALVPETADALSIPYTGCPAAMLRLALDKAKTKELLLAAGIKTPRYQLLETSTLAQFQLGYPCIVKPHADDASHGLSEASVIADFTALKRQVRLVDQSYGGAALVEEFLDGREFNATVLGDAAGTVLPISEIEYALPAGMPRLLTFAAKWAPETVYFQGTPAICPAKIPAEERRQIAETARAAFRCLGGRGYARVDMRLDKEGRLNVIEVNPNPDIGPEAGAARQSRAAGLSYTQFVARILQMALEKC